MEKSKSIQKLIFLLILGSFLIPSCARHPVVIREDSMGMVKKTPQTKEAYETVTLAMGFHDAGIYAKSAELFMKAAGMFRDYKLSDMEKAGLLAAAKVYLNANKRDEFVVTMKKLEALGGGPVLPSEEEMLLRNFAASLERKPLPYPVKQPWFFLFQQERKGGAR